MPDLTALNVRECLGPRLRPGDYPGFPVLRISRPPRPSIECLPEHDMPVRPVIGDGLDPPVIPERFGLGAVSRLEGIEAAARAVRAIERLQ